MNLFEYGVQVNQIISIVERGKARRSYDFVDLGLGLMLDLGVDEHGQEE